MIGQDGWLLCPECVRHLDKEIGRNGKDNEKTPLGDDNTHDSKLVVCSYVGLQLRLSLNIKKDPAVRNVVVARRLDDRQRPIDSTRVFEPNDTFFCSVEVENLEAGSQVTAKWFYEERNLDQFTLTTDTAGSGYLGFNLSPDTGVWSLGDYRVEIELNGSKERTVNFSVQAKESTTTPSSPITITSTAQQHEGTVSTPIVVEIAPCPAAHQPRQCCQRPRGQQQSV